MSGRRAAFLDRDGVINVDRGYVHTRGEFEFIDGVFDAAAKLRAKGYALFVITNQSGIGRGRFTEEQFLQLDAWMREQFAQLDRLPQARHVVPACACVCCWARTPKPCPQRLCLPTWQAPDSVR